MKTAFNALVRASASALAMFGLAVSSAAAATYTIVDVPDSDYTTATAINDDGDVTGFYHASAGGFFTGFLRASDGTFTTFAVKGANGTTPAAINRKGEIAGTWDTSSGFVGFVRKADGKIVGIDPRAVSDALGSGSTTMLHVNDSGDVSGDFVDHQNTEKGFFRPKDGKLGTFGVSGSGLTRPYGMNSTGVVTGFYWDMSDGAYAGFVRAADGTLTTFRFPGAQRTIPVAINDAGTVAGYYLVGETFGGFVRSADGTIETFDPPGSKQTNPVAINRRGEIAGVWLDGSRFHSFVRSAKGKITSFDPPGADSSEVRGLNNNGVIVGRFGGTDGHTHSFIRTP